MKRPFKITTAATAAGIAAMLVTACGGGGSGQASSNNAPTSANVVITHITRGCHDWAVDGGSPAPTQTVKLTRGGYMTLTNNDVMPHTLIQTSGPAAAAAQGPQMGHMGARSRVTFGTPGVYSFETKAGEDYPSAKGMETVGADHTLRMKVIVAS
jgi:plastocyanin